jgi:hypothetical protein
VLQLNVILLDFRVEEVKVVTIAISIVSLNAVAVYPNSLFRCKFNLVARYKARNLAS